MQPPASPDPTADGTSNGAGPTAMPPSAVGPELGPVPNPTIPVPGPQPPGAPAVPPPPVISDKSNIDTHRQSADQITNPIERVATLLIDAVDDHAGRLAKSLSEQPTDTIAADPQTIHEMMSFSPYGTDAPAAFWRTHDQILQEAANNHDPDPYAAAERGALDEVYPYRAKLALLDVLGPDEKVKRADQLMDISHRQIAKGQTPESLPFLVGPQGLSRDQHTLVPGTPPPPSTNGTAGGSY